MGIPLWTAVPSIGARTLQHSLLTDNTPYASNNWQGHRILTEIIPKVCLLVTCTIFFFSYNSLWRELQELVLIL